MARTYYWITRVACACTEAGIVNPSARAVF
jgi:hypothetical protein